MQDSITQEQLNMLGKNLQVAEENKQTMHIIWDFSFLYYKYFFLKKSGRIKTLTTAVEQHGTTLAKDVTIIYYTLKEIEGQRVYYERQGMNVTTTVCFDSPSLRKDMENGTGYKEGRHNSLTDEDFEDMSLIQQILEDAGHNCYKLPGYEADDLVTKICQTYKDKFDYTLIYTPDKDLAINIDRQVALLRYKSGKGYTPITKVNYASVFKSEFECTIPYNAILIFLSTVGDKSDKVKGITRFGAKAFDKLISNIEAKGINIDWEKLSDIKYLDTVIEEITKPEHGLFTEKQSEELKNSYSLVRPIEISDDFLNEKPLTNTTTFKKRVEAYSKYKFESIIYE